LPPGLYRLSVVFTIFVLGCASKPVDPHGSQPLADTQSWLVQCESSLKPRVAPGEDPETAVAKGWIAARTPDDHEIRVHGHLDDGFVQVSDILSDDPDWQLDKLQPYRQLRKVCRETLAARRDGELYRPGLVRTSHSELGVYTSLVFDDWAERDHVTRIVVFGDSLSDTGSLRRRLKLAPRQPYWVGRFANGPIWTDYLEVSADLALQNHSRGGAMATQREPMSSEELIQRLYTGGQFLVSGSITHQIEQYSEHYLGDDGLTHGDGSVAVLWAGANDYISKEAFDTSISLFLGEPHSEEGYRKVVSNVVDALEQNLKQLQNLGLTRILLINLPDLGQTPMVLHNDSFMVARNYPDEAARLLELSSRLTELTRWHNQALLEMVERFRASSPEMEVVLMDANTVFDEVIDPNIGERLMGFDLDSNRVELEGEGMELTIQDRCYSGMTLGLFASSSKVCQQASRVVFWDLVHPSTYFHCWMAYAIGKEFHRLGWTGPMRPMEEQREWCGIIADAY
jgi:phospholipase/lecithinase/hemolysin